MPGPLRLYQAICMALASGLASAGNQIVDDDTGDPGVAMDSPVIDAGDPAFTGPPDSDQRGGIYARVIDGDGDQLAVIDIGAVEIDLIFGNGFELEMPPE